MLSLGVDAVGNMCAHHRIWVPKAFWNTEILLDAIYIAGWGVGSWDQPWGLLMPLWSGRFFRSFFLRQASDIRSCYLMNGMRLARRGVFGLSSGLE